MQHKRWFLVAGSVLVAVLGATLFWYQRAGAPAYSIVKSTFDKQQYSTTDPASLWVIVNKQHPILQQDYAPSDLVSVGNRQVMRADAANDLMRMFAAAEQAGYTLIADSGFRSYDEQVAAYNSIVISYGQDYADTVSARPGYSEHQTGWAVDIGTDGCRIANCFGNLPAGKWTQANAYKFGFILRYGQANSGLTGYSAEAWHFRYVGKPLAQEMHTKHITTLEQFFDVTGGAAYKS